MTNNFGTEKIACFTLDLEQDYGRINEYKCFSRVDELCEIIKQNDIKITVFVVGKILVEKNEVIRKLAQVNAEFELHSYSHDLSGNANFENEVKLAKQAYENYFGCKPLGYRAPQGKITADHFNILQKEDFIFDSSIIPSWRPGIYSNLNASLETSKVGNIQEIPFSVIPKIHIPFIMSYMKIFGGTYKLLIGSFGLPNVMIFDFHLHDLFKSESIYELPLKYQILHNRNSLNALLIFKSFITLLKSEGYNFITLNEYRLKYPNPRNYTK